MYSDCAIKSVSFVSENNRDIKVDYFITKSNSPVEGSEGKMTYGVMAKLYINEKPMDCVRIDDVSPHENEINELIKLLAENKVTTLTLKDVIEDYVAEKYDIIK